MFGTTIIPTIGRKSLDREVLSVLNQDIHQAGFEIIIVNDSGAARSGNNWQDSEFVKVVTTNHRERCIARNVGTALSRGTNLHFLDDDDWRMQGALEAFWRIAQAHKDSAWLIWGN